MTVDVVRLCATCGHPDFAHTRGPREAGDCLQRNAGGRFDCSCEEFTPEGDGEESAA